MRKLGRRALVLLVAGVAMVAVAACGGDDEEAGGTAKEGGSLTISLTSNPDYLDPAIAYTVEAASAHWIMYPGLVSYKHEEGKAGAELIPAAAEAMPAVSSDGLTYKFKLRDGLKYSDGTPAKASDFEHTLQRMFTLEWGGLSFFESIEGVDEYLKGKKEGSDISGIEANDQTGEITIKLAEKNGQFLYTLGFPSAGLVPSKTSFKNLSKDPPPGLGAYMFEEGSIQPNREFTLVKNKNFSLPNLPKGNVDRIRVRLIKSQARQAQDVIAGKLDYMLDEPSTDLLPEIRAQYKDRYEENVTNSTYYLFMNHRRPPFNTLEARQAVNYALDKRALVRLFGGLLEADCNFLPPLMEGYEKIDPCPWGDPNEPPDVEKARQLVEEAGMKGEEVTVWGNDEERSSKVANYTTDLLNKIGFKAKTRIIGAETYYSTIGNQKTGAQIGFTNWFQDFPHPGDFFFLVESGSIQPTNNENFGNVADPEVDKLSAEIKAEPPEEVVEQSKELDRLLTSEEKAHVAAYGHTKETTFVSERMDFENCTVFHPVYRDDWSQFCLK
jgi:peptide/nickel transport system substrate-binding protein